MTQTSSDKKVPVQASGPTLDEYINIVGPDIINQLRQLAEPMQGMKVVHVNSTRVGGGVAEILHRMIPLMCELGLDTSWEVVSGNTDFYQCTKGFHNALQGFQTAISDDLYATFESTNRDNAELLRPALQDADIVFIHDPQPAPLLKLMPERSGKWIWRCHIDVSKPQRSVWKYLREWVADYDASIFSLAAFAQQLPHPMYLIPPSIDPLSAKNESLPHERIDEVYSRFSLDPNRPIITQISRYDRFKDPLGVIEAYKLVKKTESGLQLVLAGGGATDDPEGEAVLNDVYAAAGNDPDIHVLLLPSDAHTTINALQRASNIVLQKSTKEGFGLTVTEAMWKSKPVIGGDTGGIRLQVFNHQTGFLVNSPEGAALRIRYLLSNRSHMRRIGESAREFVRNNFLLTRHLREYLSLMLAQLRGSTERLKP